jgi:hypothetical protein
MDDDGSGSMSALERHLGADEAVVFRARLHPVVLGWTAVFAACVLAVVALVVARNELSPSTVAMLWAAGIAVAVTSSVLPWLRWRAGEFVVTRRRLLARVGLRRVYTVELATVERVDVQERPWARLLGYGTLRMTERNGATDVFAGIRAPQALREAVLRQARAAGARPRR